MENEEVKNIRINACSVDAMKNLGVDPEIIDSIESCIGNRIEVTDDFLRALEMLRDAGYVEFEEVEVEQENEPEIETETDSEFDESDEIEDEPDDEPTSDESEELEELTQEKKEEKFDGLKRQVIEFLDTLPAFQMLDQSIREQIKACYRSATYEEDIRDKNFLTKRMDIGESGEAFAADVSKIHLVVCGQLEMSTNLAAMQRDAENPLTQGEIYEQVTAETASQDATVISSDDSNVQREAEERLAYQVKKYIQNATTNTPATYSLVVLSDIGKYAEDIKAEYADSLGVAGERDEAIRTYIAKKPISEMTDVMREAKRATGDVRIKFDDVDFNNPLERKTAIALIKEVQQNAPELGNVEPVIDRVSVAFEIRNWEDVQRMTLACKELSELGGQEIRVAAQVEVSPQPGVEREELENAAGAVLATNNIEVEGSEPEVAIDVMEEMAQTEELSPMADMAKIAVAADRTIDAMGEILLDAVEQVIEPQLGLFGNESSNN